MAYLIRNTFVAVSAALLLTAFATRATLAQDGSVVTEDSQVGNWLVRCVTDGDAPRTCFMAANAVHPLEQRELALLQVIRVAEIDRQDGEDFAAQLTSPTNVNVRLGIEVQVDQNVIATVPYEVCTVRNCVTTFAITPDMIVAFQQGFAAALIFTDASGERVSASLSLDGFSRALENL